MELPFFSLLFTRFPRIEVALIVCMTFHGVDCSETVSHRDALLGEIPLGGLGDLLRSAAPFTIGPRHAVPPRLTSPERVDNVRKVTYLLSDDAPQEEPGVPRRAAFRAQRVAKRPGTGTLKLAAALALMASLGTEVVNYYDTMAQDEVYDFDHDERMLVARRTMGLARVAALVLATVGGVRYLIDWVKSKRDARNTTVSEEVWHVQVPHTSGGRS